mgnify:FL=1
MKQFDFEKFMKDINKREKPHNEIQEAPETPQEKLFRQHRETLNQRIKWTRTKDK